MRLLVTGATAALGAAIVKSLLADPEVELVLTVGREREASWSDPRVVYRAVDLTRSRQVHDLLCAVARHHAIDTVVHAAQHRDAHGGHRVHAQDVEAVRSLVLGCTRHPTIRRLVFRSFAEVYAQHHATTSLIAEDSPLDFDPKAPRWLRDRVEADLTVCSHHDNSLEIAVLRCAEIFAPDTGSQLWDYLSSHVCLRPAGFDPIVNLLALEDAATAFGLAARSTATGVFNIPGADTLPLSRAIAESNCADIPMPGTLLAPLYRLRHVLAGFDFRYDLNARRFHCGGVLDGSRARRELRYTPQSHVQWPRPWWRVLFERLAEAR